MFIYYQEPITQGNSRVGERQIDGQIIDSKERTSIQGYYRKKRLLMFEGEKQKEKVARGETKFKKLNNIKYVERPKCKYLFK